MANPPYSGSYLFSVSCSFALTIGSVADGLVDQLNGNSSDVLFEHPLGFMNVRLDYQNNGVHSVVRSAQIVRTARKLSSGLIYIPSIWSI